ncbi:MAG: hypothetical protein IJO87_07685 [Eggerthellaceae bacterium]|nr:hypothetical protein [Eggerthellaceae bacterium]
MANKVRFGLEKAYYALIQEDGTYSAPKHLNGAVALSLNAEGDTSNFYAENMAYYTLSTNSGYTGELELAFFEDDDAMALLGEKKAANGVIYEDAAAQPAPFVLLFQTLGNVNDKRYAMYNCTLSRPSLEANTTSDTTDPDTTTLSFTAIPAEIEIDGASVKVTKGVIENTEAGKAIYDAWYTEVQLPGAAA